MEYINIILNQLGLIGDFIKWILEFLNSVDNRILLISIFVLFFVIMFNNGIITKKSPHKRY